MGQERQFVAAPAAKGFRALRNIFREPVDVTDFGRCGGSFTSVDCVSGEQSSHRRKSIS
jgi:hypothetical protein